MSDIKLQLSIPSDNDGFVLFQCPICDEFFKIRPKDFEDDSLLGIFCPNCGLQSKNYFTEDVIALSNAMTFNATGDLINNQLKKAFQKKGLKVKVAKKAEYKPENPIVAGIEALEIKNFICCCRKAKIKPLINFYGSYCPFCGVKNFEY